MCSNKFQASPFFGTNDFVSPGLTPTGTKMGGRKVYILYQWYDYLAKLLRGGIHSSIHRNGRGRAPPTPGFATREVFMYVYIEQTTV